MGPYILRFLKLTPSRYFKTSLLAFILAAGETLAEPETSISFNYYYIFPSSLATLDKELMSRSPIRENNTTYLGRTNWHVAWNYRWYKQGGRCWFTEVKSSVKVTFTVPSIPDDFQTSSAIKLAFSHFYLALMEHENGHMNNGLGAARRIEAELMTLGYFDSCEELVNSANARAKKIIEAYNQKDIEYDNETHHGATEGAVVRNFQ